MNLIVQHLADCGFNKLQKGDATSGTSEFNVRCSMGLTNFKGLVKDQFHFGR